VHAMRSLPTQQGIGQVNPEQLEQQRQSGAAPQFQRPADIAFHKLEPEQFRDYTLYYKPDCPHSINLLSRLAKDPPLDSKVTRINVDQYQVAGLEGVPTLVDEKKQVFLGNNALRWVEAKASKDIIGLDLNDVQDVSGAPTSDLAPGDPGENFSFVHDSLMNMPQIQSLEQVDTRQQRGPQIDSQMQSIESQRNQFLKPYGDPGNLTPPAPPPQHSARAAAPQRAAAPSMQAAPRTQPVQAPPNQQVPTGPAQAAQSLFRAEMNPSQKGQKNAAYEMDRSAFLGGGKGFGQYQ